MSLNGPCINALKYQLEWPDDQVDNYTTLLNSASIAGLAFGSIIGGTLIKNGRKRIVIFFNIVLIIGSIMSLFLNTTLLACGRFVFGFASGALVAATPKIIGETIPGHVMDNGYGASTNLSINAMVMSSMLLGLGLPDSTDIDSLTSTSFWKVMYLIPAAVSAIAIFFNIYVHTEDSLNFHVAQGDKLKALAMISKLYPKENEMTYEKVYQRLV